MRLKILLKRTFLIIVLAGLALFPMFLFYFNLKNLIQSVSAPLIKNIVVPLKQEQAAPAQGQANSLPASLVETTAKPADQTDSGLPALPTGRPVRLKIPGINVDAALESVGLTLKGAVDVPKGLGNAAWFNLGPRPGEIGSAVITGHYGRWKNGAGSVFDDLNKLNQGDKLYVEDDKGVITSFVVRASRSYDPNADAPEVFDSNDGKPHLNLITCEGVWNINLKSYPKRLVVFTDKE